MDDGTPHTAEMPTAAERSTSLCHLYELFFKSLHEWQRPSLSVTAHQEAALMAFTVLGNLNVDYKKPLFAVTVIAFSFLKNIGGGGEGLKQNKRMLCCSVTDNILSLKLPLKLL